MAAKVCLDCQTVYAADLEQCPHCGFKKSRWDYEEPPAKPKAAAAAGKGDDS